MLTDSEGNVFSTVTSSFGNYRFEDVEVGENYVISVNSKRYRFASRVINLVDTVSDLDLIGLE